MTTRPLPGSCRRVKLPRPLRRIGRIAMLHCHTCAEASLLPAGNFSQLAEDPAKNGVVQSVDHDLQVHPFCCCSFKALFRPCSREVGPADFSCSHDHPSVFRRPPRNRCPRCSCSRTLEKPNQPETGRTSPKIKGLGAQNRPRPARRAFWKNRDRNPAFAVDFGNAADHWTRR